MKTETFDSAADFLAALNGKPRAKRGRATRADIPSAGRAAPTGLTPLLVAGWAYTYVVALGHKLERGELSTGWCADEATCCKVAKGLC